MKWKKFLDCICFVGGPFVLALFLSGLSGSDIWFGWSGNDQFGIGFGVALICFGFLRKYWERSYRQPNKEA